MYVCFLCGLVGLFGLVGLMLVWYCCCCLRDFEVFVWCCFFDCADFGLLFVLVCYVCLLLWFCLCGWFNGFGGFACVGFA